MSSIITVGSVALDSIETHNNSVQSVIGGSATYFSIAASLFASVKIVGIVGEDFPEKGIDIFKNNNINIDNLERAKGTTFKWSCRYNSDFSHRETLLTDLGVFENFNPSQIIGEEENDILFLANIHPSLQKQIINISKEKKLIACDTMNLWINNNLDDLHNVLSDIDLFFLNEEEAFMMSKSTNLMDCFEHISSIGPNNIIIKLGERGCAVFEDGKITEMPAIPVKTVIDPTGAGDCFAGGVLGYMANANSTLIEAIDYGSAVASCAIEGFGVNQLLSVTPENLISRVKSLRK
jgi:sugar/nucleoside kinase (ribokinase family)